MNNVCVKLNNSINVSGEISPPKLIELPVD